MAGGEGLSGMDRPKSELRLRLLSAGVMLALAGVAFYQGGLVLDLFIAVVAGLAGAEMAALILKIQASALVRAVALLAGILYVALAAIALVQLPALLVAGIVGIVIFTDTGAYIAGRTFGGPKIAPRISPSKTWAGLLGGMLAAALLGAAFLGFIAMAVSALAPQPAGVPWAAIFSGAGIGAVLAVVAQAGDFLESWLKRRAGVKE